MASIQDSNDDIRTVVDAIDLVKQALVCELGAEWGDEVGAAVNKHKRLNLRWKHVRLGLLALKLRQVVTHNLEEGARTPCS